MPEINAARLELELKSTFARYLFSANGIAENEPELRDAFWQALGQRDVFARPPLLTVMPAYRVGASAAELVARESAPMLHARIKDMKTAAFDPERPLYLHQTSSVERVQQGHNLIVASGTGSGKTECFLLPILDDALRNPGPGVRAIIVYPLNALANDQLERLRVLLKRVPEVTYGRYTGETPFSAADLTPEQLQRVGGDNERFTRQEIRQSPPHILLTNFAMLEYLLLRPNDADVFRQQRLRFVVLDEAHTYQGAQGIDVGLLMRRLQRAYPKSAVQFILTSATLGGDRESIAEFGHSLTGAAFESGDVATGERSTGFAEQCEPKQPFEAYLKAVPDDEAQEKWVSALDDVQALRRLLEDAGFQSVPTEASVPGLLCSVFSRNADMQRLHEVASRKPLTPQDLANALWGRTDSDAVRVVQWLAMLGANAAASRESPPLVPLRTHLFFKGLQAASVCLSTKCVGHGEHPDTPWSHFMLESRNECERCKARVLPLLTCVHCGLPVVRVYQPHAEDKWTTNAGLPNSSRPHVLAWKAPLAEVDDANPDLEGNESPYAEVCLSCGALAVNGEVEANCCQNREARRLFLLESDEAGNVRRCPNCRSESRRFASVMREFGTGEDAATAVLGETLVRALPSEDAAKPASGRRLLVFSDSRQRAAYFAPFLQRTTGETQVMRPLLAAIDKALSMEPGGATFDDIAYHFGRLLEHQPYVIVREVLDEDADEFRVSVKRPGQLQAADRSALRRDCKVALLRHFTSQSRRRDTLPGLALAALTIDFSGDQREHLERTLPSAAGLQREQAFAFIQYLLNVVVRRRALQLPEDVTGRMLGPGPAQATMHREEAGPLAGRTRIRWNSYRARTNVEAVVRRSPQISAIAAVLGVDPIADQARVETALERIWCVLRDSEILIPLAPGEYVLPDRVLTVTRPDEWWLCDTCGALTPWLPAERCLLPGCSGRVARISAGDSVRWNRNHQRNRFTEVGPLPMRVREHTAQLTLATGQDYQREFMSGDANVLSSSTTFEMGIDVGQLRAIFLRNVPPTAGNYIQRAGRAGRRREGAAFAVTFARAVPHDQNYFFAPEEIAGGTVGVPRINMANRRLAQRHVNSLLLGRYLASLEQVDESPSVETFFRQPDVVTSPAGRFSQWTTEEEKALRADLSAVIPRECELNASEALDESREVLSRWRTMWRRSSGRTPSGRPNCSRR